MKNKKKYVITLHYTVQKDVEIEAESLEEAKNKAVKTAGSDLNKEDGVLTAVCKNLFVRDNATGKTWYPKKDVA